LRESLVLVTKLQIVRALVARSEVPLPMSESIPAHDKTSLFLEAESWARPKSAAVTVTYRGWAEKICLLSAAECAAPADLGVRK